MIVAVRFILTGFLVFMVCKETGPWTALTLALLALANEAAAWHMDRLMELLSGIQRNIAMLVDKLSGRGK